MSTTRRQAWERMLLVAALVVGVLVMHATPELCATRSPQAPPVVSATTSMDPGHTGAGHGGDRHGCGDHHVLAACLAILIGAALLVAAAWRVRRAGPAPPARPRRLLELGFPTSRASPRTAVRLAQLCVSRR